MSAWAVRFLERGITRLADLSLMTMCVPRGPCFAMSSKKRVALDVLRPKSRERLVDALVCNRCGWHSDLKRKRNKALVRRRIGAKTIRV
jgi:hypothetical protein